MSAFSQAPPMPRLMQMKTPSRSPLPRRPTVLPTGPRIFRQTKGSVHFHGGPGLAPPGFKRASTSASEWIWYWASMTVLDPDRDPRRPPFYGGRLWDYQSPELGAFTRQAGTAVVDFLYKVSFPYLVVRIQTYRFHLATTSLKQAYDRKQREKLAGKFSTIDVYEGDYIADRTGQAAILLLRDTLGLAQRPGPLVAGTTYLVRNAITS